VDLDREPVGFGLPAGVSDPFRSPDSTNSAIYRARDRGRPVGWKWTSHGRYLTNVTAASGSFG
jgi:hypothetical protein